MTELNVKSLYEELRKEIEEMSDEEFQRAYDEAKCGDLRWMLEYAWNPDLDEFMEWRTCFKYMWE